MATPTWESGLHEIAPGVFAYVHGEARWDKCNSGFIVGDEGVMVIDAMMVGSMVKPYLEAIRKVTTKPVRYVVNTHHHVDHSFGNQFYDAAEVVSHTRCRQALVERGVDVAAYQKQWPQYSEDWPKVNLMPATITYENKMVVHLGNRVVELLYPGAAHTYGDTLIYLPQDKVLFTGDVAFHYLIPLARDGHVSSWIKVARGLINRLDAATVMPGHGPVGDKTAIVKTLDYLQLLKRTCQLHFQQGAGIDEAERAMHVDEYDDWGEHWRIPINVERMYKELRGELPRPPRVKV